MSLVFPNNLIIYTTEYEINYNNSPMKYSNGKLILIYFPSRPMWISLHLFYPSVHSSTYDIRLSSVVLLHFNGKNTSSKKLNLRFDHMCSLIQRSELNLYAVLSHRRSHRNEEKERICREEYEWSSRHIIY